MSSWEFWIDVGGTFTDSFARRADGRLTHYKVLSSGVIKGAAGPESNEKLIVDPARAADPPNIWAGFRLRLLDVAGKSAGESRVRSFDARTSTLALETPLASAPSPGTRYELSADIEAPIVAIRYLMGLPLVRPIPPVSV